MSKRTDYLSTLDEERFPGIRVENHRNRWLPRECAFFVIVVLILCYGQLSGTTGQQVNNLAPKTSQQVALVNSSVVGTALTSISWLGGMQETFSHSFAGLKAIPKGILIPMEIESAEFGGAGRVAILARTKLYLVPDKTVVIPPAEKFGESPSG